MMRRRKLFWFLFPSYVLITTGALVALGAYARVSVRGFYLDLISTGLESRAELFASEVSRRLAADDSAGLDESAKDRGQASRTRITVIAPSGLVLADSENQPATMNNHRYREEIAVAFDERRVGDSMRYSDTMDTRYKYVAVPLVENGEVVAVIRASQSVAVIDRQLHALDLQILVAGLVGVALTIAASWLLARSISRPVESMTIAAQEFAAGRLNHRLEPAGSVELVDLANAMNQMAAQLSDRIDTIVREQNQRDAILGSMEEGVLALDETGHILRVNPAASRILKIDADDAPGKLLHELVRQRELLDFVDAALASGTATQCDLVLRGDFRGDLRGDPEKHVQLHGSVLNDTDGTALGLLIVMRDVTQLRQLQQLRTEQEPD